MDCDFCLRFYSIICVCFFFFFILMIDDDDDDSSPWFWNIKMSWKTQWEEMKSIKECNCAHLMFLCSWLHTYWLPINAKCYVVIIKNYAVLYHLQRASAAVQNTSNSMQRQVYVHCTVTVVKTPKKTENHMRNYGKNE